MDRIDWKIEEVVVALDTRKEAERAIPVAVAVAAQLGAKLTFVTILYDEVTRPGQTKYMDDLRTRHPGVAVEVIPTIDHDPGVGLVQMGATRPNALLCMATNSPGAVADFVLGSVMNAVCRSGWVPMLLVGPKCKGEWSGATGVMGCIDGSEIEDAVAGVAHSLAEQLNVPLTLVQAVEALDSSQRRGLGATRAMLWQHPEGLPSDDVSESAHVGNVARRLGPEVSWDVLHHGGHPAASVVDQANLDVRVLPVLATHGRRGLERWRLGSVATKVVHDSHGPVVVVPHALADALVAKRGGR